MWRGPQSPWEGRVYDNDNLTGKSATARRPMLRFAFRSNEPFTGYGNDWSARWKSCLFVPSETTLTFRLSAVTHARLIIDGKKVVDRWLPKAKKSQDSAPSVRPTHTNTLKPGFHAVVIEHGYHKEKKNKPALTAGARLHGESTYRDLDTFDLRPLHVHPSCK